MNRRIFAILAVLFITGNITLTEAQTETAPPEINDVWSIFSLPCTVDLLTATGKKDAFEGGVFEWNGSNYSKTTLIERGVGYITNVKNSGHIKQLCSGQIDTDDKTIIYKTGWNLAGNPYKKAVLFTELPGIPSKLPKHILYELRGQKFVDITDHPVLNPWQGYWLYTEEELSISLAKNCSLELLAYSDADKTIELEWPVESKMKTIFLAPMETCTGDDGFSSRTDKTIDASWAFRGDNTGTISKSGEFTPVTPGTSVISATVANITTKSRTISISTDCHITLKGYSDSERTALLSFENSLNTYAPIFMDVINTCYQADGTADETEMTSKTDWNISPDIGATINNKTAVFSANTNGEYKISAHYKDYSIHAKYGEYESNTISVTFAVPECVLELLAYDSYEMTTPLNDIILNYGGTLFLSLNKVCSLNDEIISNEKVSDTVTWNLGKPELAKIDSSTKTLIPIRTGETDIYATYSDRDSNKIHITILNPTCEYKIIPFSDASMLNEIISTPEITSSQRIFLKPVYECKLRNTTISKEDVEKKIACTSEDINNKSFMDTKTGEFIPSGVGYGTSVCAVEDASISINIRLITELSFFKITTSPYIYTSSLKTNVNVYGLYRNKCSDEEINCNQQLRIQNLTQEADIIVNGQSSTDKGEINAAFCNNDNYHCYIQLQLDRKSNYFYLMYRNFDDYTYTYTNKNGEISDPQPVSFYISNYTNHYPNEFIKIRPIVDGYELIDDFTWETMDSSIVSIEDGYPIAKSPGTTYIRAKFHNRTTDWTWINVTYNYNYENLRLGRSTSKPVRTNEYVRLYLDYYKYELSDYCTNATETIYDDCFVLKDYNVFNQNAITSTSDNLIFKDNSFTSTEPGFVKIEAEYNGLKSSFTMDFWEEKEMHYCDGAVNNISDWNDSEYGAHVMLESSCNEYEKDDTVYIKYTAEIPTGTWYYGHCLELYVVDENYQILKTFRKNQYCGSAPLNSGRSSSRSMDKIYETVEDWDMTDDFGNRVGPGQYYAVARFNIYMDPVVEVPFVIKPDSSSESVEIQE